jgi:succinate dehydrogenase/fumarate reductase flavoprotein subunit
MSGNNTLHPNDLFALENQVISDLTDFNKKYTLFLRCENTNNPNRSKINFVDQPCPTNTISIRQDAINAYNKLTNTSSPIGSIVQLQNAINKMDSDATTPKQYLQNYHNIMNSYTEIVKKRQSLDASLVELYEIGDNSSSFYQKKLVSTSYTKILLTILATSLTVAVFISIRNKNK